MLTEINIISKIIWAKIITIFFLLFFAAIYLLHIYYFKVDVIFYSAIEDAIIAALLAALAALIIRAKLPLNCFEFGLIFMIWCIFGYAAAISGPTVLDRSLSFYILEKLQQRGGGIRADAISRVFTEEYMPEFRLVDVRLTEQVQSGTVEITNNCVRLTEKGQRLASFSRYIRQHLLAKHRLLAGEYTDALVDPFKNSKQGPQGYECQ